MEATETTAQDYEETLVIEEYGRKRECRLIAEARDDGWRVTLCDSYGVSYLLSYEEAPTAQQAVALVRAHVQQQRQSIAEQTEKEAQERVAADAATSERRTEALRRYHAGDTAEIVTAYRCSDCEHVFDEEPEDDTFYECGNCGNEFSRSEVDSHRCEQCGKFAGKSAETTCPECMSGIDGFEQVEALDVNGDLIVIEESEED